METAFNVIDSFSSFSRLMNNKNWWNLILEKIFLFRNCCGLECRKREKEKHASRLKNKLNWEAEMCSEFWEFYLDRDWRLPSLVMSKILINDAACFIIEKSFKFLKISLTFVQSFFTISLKFCTFLLKFVFSVNFPEASMNFIRFSWHSIAFSWGFIEFPFLQSYCPSILNFLFKFIKFHQNFFETSSIFFKISLT